MSKLDRIKSRVHQPFALDEEQSEELRKLHERTRSELRKRPAPVPLSKLPESQVDSELAALVAAAGPDERRVLLFLCRRFIGIGQRDFGQLDVRSDPRDGFEETAEEAADGLFYMSLWFLKQQLNRPLVPEAQGTEPGQLQTTDNDP